MLTLRSNNESLLLGPDVIVAAEQLYDYSGQPAVLIELAPGAAAKLAALTQANVGRTIDILIQDRIVASPVIREPILAGRVSITGISEEEAKVLLAR